MHHIISWSIYWRLNEAVIVSYFTVMLFTPYFFKNSLYRHQLKYTRTIFIVTILILLLFPFVGDTLAIPYNDLLQLDKFFKETSSTLLVNRPIMFSQQSEYPIGNVLYRLDTVLIIVIFSGMIISFLRYIKNLFRLRKLIKHSFCLHRIGKSHILLVDNINTPFCWSLLLRHFVFIPVSFLQNPTDFKLTVRHELQHLRQKDTYWLTFYVLIKIVCFWNPVTRWWLLRMNQLQEFACDEALILRKNTSSISYAQTLINAAAKSINQTALTEVFGVSGLSQNNCSLLTRRVSMLFQYKRVKKSKKHLIVAYCFSLFAICSFAYAFNSNVNQQITKQQLQTLTNKPPLQATITPEVLAAINNIRANKQAHQRMEASLARMNQYQSYISAELKHQGMPNNLLALPLVESGYNMQSKSPVSAAGIWQFIPSTAKRFNLTIDAQRDDRLNTKLSTHAALSFLKGLYAQFHDWKLAVIAYEIGEDHTMQLIRESGSQDAWTIVRSQSAPKDLKKFLALFDTSILIINNPSLIA